MKIYTRSGDHGTTRLYTDQEIAKDALRVEAYGTLDELGSHLGLACHQVGRPEEIMLLRSLQRTLFNLAGELATVGRPFPEPITETDVAGLEEQIDRMLSEINRTQESRFILPGSTPVSAQLHICRAVCRRAERRMVSLSKDEVVSDTALRYINRLSDLLYALARIHETAPQYVVFGNTEK